MVPAAGRARPGAAGDAQEVGRGAWDVRGMRQRRIWKFLSCWHGRTKPLDALGNKCILAVSCGHGLDALGILRTSSLAGRPEVDVRIVRARMF